MRAAEEQDPVPVEGEDDAARKRLSFRSLDSQTTAPVGKSSESLREEMEQLSSCSMVLSEFLKCNATGCSDDMKLDALNWIKARGPHVGPLDIISTPRSGIVEQVAKIATISEKIRLVEEAENGVKQAASRFEHLKIQIKKATEIQIQKLKASFGSGTMPEETDRFRVKMDHLATWQVDKEAEMKQELVACEKSLHDLQTQVMELVSSLISFLDEPQETADTATDPFLEELVKELDAMPTLKDASDGTMSPPNSQQLALEQIAKLPESQCKTALMALCEAQMVAPSNSDKARWCCFMPRYAIYILIYIYIYYYIIYI